MSSTYIKIYDEVSQGTSTYESQPKRSSDPDTDSEKENEDEAPLNELQPDRLTILLREVNDIKRIMADMRRLMAKQSAREIRRRQRRLAWKRHERQSHAGGPVYLGSQYQLRRAIPKGLFGNYRRHPGKMNGRG